MSLRASSEQAVKAALSGNWKEAISLNSELLKADEHDLETRNRLGYAYLMNGQPTLAKREFQKVLERDPYNQIASKNSRRLGAVKAGSKHPDGTMTASANPLHFLEDPGKTKIVACVNLAPATVMNAVTPGQQVFIKAKNHCVELRTDQNIYLAALPDDLSFKLLRFIDSGNTYSAHVKTADKNLLVVIIREVARSKRFANQPSFITSGAATFIPYSRTARSEDKPDVSETGEEEDPGNTEEGEHE
ncbi:hypothetical protein M1555_04860 [Patescibacteria group bacterium]|nr:hypothetical protein [Patescibacteria group bacterium]